MMVMMVKVVVVMVIVSGLVFTIGYSDRYFPKMRWCAVQCSRFGM